LGLQLRESDNTTRSQSGIAHLPEGPAYFEDGQVTDKTERQIVSELIREKVILETRDELPYAAHVDVERFEDERPKIVRIAATVVVERSSQKPIVIGRGGERIKAIGVRARQELEHFLDAHVFLELHVRVQENWTNSPTLLADLGYSSEGDVAAAGDAHSFLLAAPVDGATDLANASSLASVVKALMPETSFQGETAASWIRALCVDARLEAWGGGPRALRRQGHFTASRRRAWTTGSVRRPSHRAPRRRRPQARVHRSAPARCGR
jgi:hypothetical protein